MVYMPIGNGRINLTAPDITSQSLSLNFLMKTLKIRIFILFCLEKEL